MLKKTLLVSALLLATLSPSYAADYKIDDTHTFIEFKVQHLGYSWLYGRFNRMAGTVSYDAKDPKASQLAITIDTTSVDTNHAERDKHLRSDDFLDVEQFPEASFTSRSFTPDASGGGTLTGELTLHGVTKPITLAVEKIGEGKDPWGGYRIGFLAKINLVRSDFGISYNLGPASETVTMELGIEAIRQ